MILLAGDVATNPGPTRKNSHHQNGSQNFFAKCLVINARSLISSHKLNGKQSCNLTNFQNLVHSEQADIVWVTETWSRETKNYLQSEIPSMLLIQAPAEYEQAMAG